MTINWQEIIVAVILILCGFLIGRKTFLFFRKVQKKENPCDGCITGCELKRQLDEKRRECGTRKPKSTKKCCG